MGPTSVFPALVVIVLALLAMEVSDRIFAIRPLKGRFGAIDGLRGYLAIFVFLHHSSIWYCYLHTRQWAPPHSNLYDHFGPTSVGVFFMITSFLFFSKLIDARSQIFARSTRFDWRQLYRSRVMRIMPLYLLAIGILFIIVAILSDFHLHQPLSSVVLEMLKWLAFITTDMNGVLSTQLIVAGVIWSLAFEWLFYFTLPLFGLLFFRIRISWPALALTTTFLILFSWIIVEFYPEHALLRMMPFLGGIVAAFVSRNEKARRLASHRLVSVGIAIALFVIAQFYQPIDFHTIPFLLLVAIFIAIAAGNSLFGILTHRISRTLGQISYSIYLLHGIILFAAFHFVLGWNRAVTLSPSAHWAVIAACSVALVLICSATYKYIEWPAMNRASRPARDSRDRG